ncbi:MAG: pantoate--beta-alanine ligase [Planctomycetes bacterium RBG_13_63_9]|nr:MAG: pantoate--beta-alanine ligase [Planctomycetes bacterium RBG_13_63_9]
MANAGRPELVTRVAQLRDVLGAVRRAGKRIGLVPTMGALHEGHLSLVRRSKAECDYTVVSIFVNPSQFGPREDLDSYPRMLDADLDGLADCDVELAFAPTDEEVYGRRHATWVEVGSVAEPLEGQCRGGHFRGVATIVLKLLNMVGPDVAYLGQKDYQQALVIRRMVEDLDVPVELCVCPTVREPGGLAMSSRNARLSPNARQRAIVLYESLELAGDLVARGERDARAIAERMREVIMTAEDARIDYVALVDPDSLEPVEEITAQTLAALAVKIENTRLIDNRLLEPPAK